MDGESLRLIHESKTTILFNISRAKGEIKVDHSLREALENRRSKLINKLIAFKVYKKGDKHLFELTLSELETEYKRFQ